jgi:hypothetical protein
MKIEDHLGIAAGEQRRSVFNGTHQPFGSIKKNANAFGGISPKIVGRSVASSYRGLMSQPAIFDNDSNVIWPVQPCCEKYCA